MKISEKTRNAFLEDLLKAPELWIQTPEQLRVDKEFALQAVGNNFMVFEYFSDEYVLDSEIQKRAFQGLDEFMKNLDKFITFADFNARKATIESIRKECNDMIDKRIQKAKVEELCK